MDLATTTSTRGRKMERQTNSTSVRGTERPQITSMTHYQHYPHHSHHPRSNAEAGFSLLELVIVCAIITITAALSLASFANRDQAGRFMADVAARIRERRASAVRLNALTEPTLLENFRQPAIGIDFSQLSTTAPLVVEGPERTSFAAPSTPGGTGTWNIVRQGTALQIPSGWRFAASASQLSPIPLIALGTPATALNFTADGKLDLSSLPSATSNTDANVESPFPAVYLTNGTSARAVAVHPSGLVELWQYDEQTHTWNGFSNRNVTATPTPTPLPTATPTPEGCTIGASPSPLSVARNGSTTVTVTLSNFSGSGTIAAAGSGASHVTVSPSALQVTGSQSAIFTVNVMTSNGSVNFASPCGSTNLTVNTF